MDIGKSLINPSVQRPGDRSIDRSSSPSFKDRMQALDEDFDDQEPLMDGPVAPTPQPNPTLQSSPTERPLPPEVLVVVDKLVESLRDCSKKGIGRTRINLDLKTLSRIEIIIDHYDTAPHTFHIKLMGNEKAQLFFNQQKGALQNQLKNTLPTFHCSISAPTFRPQSFLKKRDEKNPLVKSDGLSYGDDKEALEAHE